VRGFTADVLATNPAMLAVFRRAGCHMTTRLVEGAYEVQMLFPPAADEVVNPRSAQNKPRSPIRGTSQAK
jgi:hypothetical protein